MLRLLFSCVPNPTLNGSDKIKDQEIFGKKQIPVWWTESELEPCQGVVSNSQIQRDTACQKQSYIFLPAYQIRTMPRRKRIIVAISIQSAVELQRFFGVSAMGLKVLQMIGLYIFVPALLQFFIQQTCCNLFSTSH